MGSIQQYLKQALEMNREAFVLHHPASVILRCKAIEGFDPRSEYCSTLKYRRDPRTNELIPIPPPPLPHDVVIPVKKDKADTNSFADKILLGRTETNDIVVSHLTVSKHHAYFRPRAEESGGLCVIDAGSTNGTKLNGIRLIPKEARTLADGDQVAFGDPLFIYYSPGGFYDLLRSLPALR